MIFGNPSYMSAKTIADSILLREWLLAGRLEPLKQIPYPCEITTQAELQELVKMSREIDGIRLAEIQEMDVDMYGVWSRFLDSHGVTVSAEELHTMIEPYIVICDYLKVWYNRPRPHQAAGFYKIPLYPRLENVPIESAYPGGHTLLSLFIFHFISLSHPELTQVMMEKVLDIKLGREQGGLHYPSDSVFSFQIFNHIRPYMTPTNTFAGSGVFIEQPSSI